MRFNSHWQVDGKHAFLGASKYHWINYDEEKMRRIFANTFASQRGTRLHNFAAEAIRLKIRMKDNDVTLNRYINDAIRFRMEPEVVLYYNDDCFGTADAISFDKKILRIHDLKTGVHPGSPHQCEIYAALFCLEYEINPYDIEMLFAIYQNDEVFPFTGDPKRIREIMDLIRFNTKIIGEMREVME